MNFFSVVKLFGGLALFLYGMSLLGTGLERASGGRLERTLEKLTSNVIKGVLLGALVTAAIQSSSATTVIVVGLVNAKVLKLRNAIGVIMGANIGTTITAHIIRLSDLESSNFFLMLLKPDSLAPLAGIVGILLFMTAKRSRRRDIGVILIGFSVLFTGMFAMEAAVRPLAALPAFEQAFSTFATIPLLGVLVGAIVTAVIQSSSASVGILQALSSTGQITYAMAFPIIMGQNIGTTITPILSSIGASKNAKRSAVVHVVFNVLGTLIFLVGCYAIQNTISFPFWNDVIDKGGIANFHTVFNIGVTLLFIPFVSLFEKLACHLIKDENADEKNDVAALLDERFLVAPGLAVDHAREAVLQMAVMAQANLGSAISLIDKYDAKLVERINENEDTVDKMENRVEAYLLALSEREISETENRAISELLHTCGEFERIADHAQNITEAATRLYETKTTFSKKGFDDMHAICEAVMEIVELAITSFRTCDPLAVSKVEPLEEIIDEMERTLRDKHIERLRRSKCTVDAAFPFVEVLSNLERIADLCSNVGESVIIYDGDHKSIDRHDYKKVKEQTPAYQARYVEYSNLYLKRINAKDAKDRLK